MNQIVTMAAFAAGEHVEPPSPDLQIRLVESGAFTCKFIIGAADANAMCCGAPTTGKSWCAYHRSIVFDTFKSRPR